MLEALLFDLDETLYRPGTGMLQAGDRTITRFVSQALDIAHEEADRIRHDLWQRYGTSAAGLEVEHGIKQADVYAGSIETLDASQYITNDPELDDMLSRIRVPLYIFTNSTRPYCERVLDALGIRHHFEDIFDVTFTDWCPKPNSAAYTHIIQALGLPPECVGLVEDNAANLAPAVKLGMTTFLLRNGDDSADYVLDDILELYDILKRDQLCPLAARTQ